MRDKARSCILVMMPSESLSLQTNMFIIVTNQIVYLYSTVCLVTWYTYICENVKYAQHDVIFQILVGWTVVLYVLFFLFILLPAVVKWHFHHPLVPDRSQGACSLYTCSLYTVSTQPPCFSTITCVMDNNVKKQIPHTE